MNVLNIEGGCLCGAIRYRSTVNPIRGVICHCSMCRKHSGAPALAFFHFPAESFTWVKGKPKRYRSSRYAERGFCPDCGSILTMHEEVLDDRVQVTAGSLDHPESVNPDDHVWTQDQLPWLKCCDDLPKFERDSPVIATRANEE
jgi:hypothetical protein